MRITGWVEAACAGCERGSKTRAVNSKTLINLRNKSPSPPDLIYARAKMRFKYATLKGKKQTGTQCGAYL
jgi:hypothetical protein